MKKKKQRLILLPDCKTDACSLSQSGADISGPIKKQLTLIRSHFSRKWSVIPTFWRSYQLVPWKVGTNSEYTVTPRAQEVKMLLTAVKTA